VNTPINEQRDDLAQRAVESVARQSYGRLVALLSARTRDVAAAEDALADALMSALTTWPRDGVPQNPQAWLMTAARNRLLDHARHRWVRDNSAPTIELMMSDLYETADPDALPDERLKLMLVCAHPAIDPDMHTPLMLQTVLGLDAVAISRAFLVSPKTMGQPCSTRSTLHMAAAGRMLPARIVARWVLPRKRSGSRECCAIRCRKNPKCMDCSR
jgi:RNA polymerase sigma-70 factor (ECF subfamily)